VQVVPSSSVTNPVGASAHGMPPNVTRCVCPHATSTVPDIAPVSSHGVVSAVMVALPTAASFAHATSTVTVTAHVLVPSMVCSTCTVHFTSGSIAASGDVSTVSAVVHAVRASAMVIAMVFIRFSSTEISVVRASLETSLRHVRPNPGALPDGRPSSRAFSRRAGWQSGINSGFSLRSTTASS
jgi:hypothetical protein